MNDTVVAIVSAFFVIGIVFGVITVVAMSVLRAGRPGDPGDPGDSGAPPDYRRGGPPSGDDNPRWPGGVDNDFHGR